jgi:D-alanyl-D-alanine carboxypeptidase
MNAKHSPSRSVARSLFRNPKPDIPATFDRILPNGNGPRPTLARVTRQQAYAGAAASLDEAWQGWSTTQDYLEFRLASQREESLLRSFLTLHLIALIIGIALVLPTMMPAQAAPSLREYAGIVVDAKSGKVLYENAADAKRYPASVTKVMTLYILFQELEAGNLSLSTKMTVSKHAASAVPTKLGLKAGSTISVENAIKALVTLSANDIARVIAEHISGSESKFAERMTSTAHALGMARTTYKNASGLPDSGQITTVRDQAILGIAVYQHFPGYYDYFQIKSFKFGKSSYGNHNRLLGSSGVDGIKTGYINSSGFNLLTAARKDDRHIVVVGFGFESSKGRDNKVLELVQKYLPKARKGSYLDVAMIPLPGRSGTPNVMVASSGPVFVTPMPFPNFRIASLTEDAVLAAPETQVAAVAAAVVEPVATPEAEAAVTTAALTEVAAVTPEPAPIDLGLQPAVEAANLLGGPTSIAPQPVDRSDDVIGAFISETYVLGAPPAELGPDRAVGAHSAGRRRR